MNRLYIDVQKAGHGRISHFYLDLNTYKKKFDYCEYLTTLYEYVSEDSEYHDVNGYPVKPVKVSDVREYKETYKNVSNHRYCGDIKEKYQFIAENYPDELTFDMKRIPVCFFDIETESASGFPEPWEASNPVTAISMYLRHLNKTIVLGSQPDYTPTDDVTYYYFSDERQLLERFWYEINHNDICFLIGWNSVGFDIPYLVNRSNNIGLELKKLLPAKNYYKKFEKDAGKNGAETYIIPGIVHYDYQILLRKYYNEKFESYGLDFIARTFLDDGKVSYLEEHKSLSALYENDYQMYIEYNIKDSILISDLDKKLQLFPLVLSMVYLSKCNPCDGYSSMRLWDSIVYNQLIKNKIVVPNEQDFPEDKYAGAYVSEPNPGLYEWATSYDVNSLYPNTMISMNISALKHIPYDKLPPEVQRKSRQMSVDRLLQGDVDLSCLKNYKMSIAPNGAVFDISSPDLVNMIVENIFNKRKELRKKAAHLLEQHGETDEYKALDNNQWALKILINSYYGCVGNRFFRFYNRDAAEAVTSVGQYLIRKTSQEVEKRLSGVLKGNNQFVFYNDTDSMYINLNPFVKDYQSRTQPFENDKQAIELINKISDKYIFPTIKETFSYICDYLNAYKNNFKMAKEKIMKKMIILVKKKYIMYVVEDDGKYLEKPKTKVKGVEIVRTDTPNVLRKQLKSMVDYILEINSEDKLKDKIKEFKKEYLSFPIDKICIPKGCSEVREYTTTTGMGYDKGCPIHIRAAILYNQMILKTGIDKKYPRMKDGDKIKYTYLKLPNPIKEDVIGYPNGYDLPKDFALDKYVDRELMFEKTFLASLKRITDVIGWNILDNKSVELF